MILDALKQGSDLGIVYWSRSQRKYLRRVVTPLDLDVDSLKAFDHSIQDVRLFKVVRIRQITLLPPGTHDAPAHLAASLAMRVVSISLLAALAVGVTLLFRVHSSQAPARLPGPPTNSFTTLPSVVTNRVTEVWQIVVDDDPHYDNVAVAQILENALHCSSSEAQALMRTIRSTGQAPVWRGSWTEAERTRQFLEGEDLVARVERVEAGN